VPLALPPAPAQPIPVVYVHQPQPIVPMPPPQAQMQPQPHDPAEPSLDAPMIVAMSALGAAIYWAFLREPDRPPMGPDPFLSSCPQCNPLMVMGVAQPCDHMHAEPPAPSGEIAPAMAPTIVVVGGNR
jgi:hypothetical protein